MECKPTAEQVKDFKDHIVWKAVNEWLEARKEEAKSKLLKADSMEKVIGLQKEHEAYTSVQVKINNLSKESQ